MPDRIIRSALHPAALVRSPALRTLILLCIACNFTPGCARNKSPAMPPLLTGLDRLARGEIPSLNGLRIGVITNQTGRTRDGRHIADVLAENPEIHLAALFGPEHGIRGAAERGQHIGTFTDTQTGVPVYSLYGKTRKPMPEMLAGLDALVFDIQDIGARFYTYISTMALAMEAAAEAGCQFVVLDRPNPIGGHIVEGPVLDPELRSFIGIQPIPIRHGMTVGELARLFNEEGWLSGGVHAELRVITCKNWQRQMVFADYGDTWRPPSPNIPTPAAAILYPGMALIETLQNFSEGRGTRTPFEVVGAPWLESGKIIDKLRGSGLKGVRFEETEFTPVDLPGMATHNKFDGEKCRGIRFFVEDPGALYAVRLGFHLLAALVEQHGQRLKFRGTSMDRFSGQKWIFPALLRGTPADTLIARWQPKLRTFLKLRQKYLLY